MLIKAPNTGEPMQTPYMHVVNKQALVMMKAAALLSFGPSSRAGIAAASREAFVRDLEAELRQ